MTAWDDARPYFANDAVAHLATLRPDGSPHSTPVWVSVEGDRLAVFMVEGSPKDTNLRRDDRVAISVTNPANPQDMAFVRGHASERLEGEAAMAVVDRVARLYTGAPYEERSGFVAYLIEPTAAWAKDFTAG